MPCRDSWDWRRPTSGRSLLKLTSNGLLSGGRVPDVAIRYSCRQRRVYCIKKFFDLFVSHGRPLWLLINPVTTVEPFANVVDADLPCVLMASVGPVVGGQGVINDPDPFGAAARGILTAFSAHALPDVVWNALFDGNLLLS